MGSTSPKPIQLNVNVNVGGRPAKLFKTSIDPNNPSTININSTNEIVGTTQTDNNNRNNNNNETNENTKNTKNNGNNENAENEAAPGPAPLSSVNSTKKPKGQFNINEDGEDNGNQIENEQKTSNNITKGNININFGGSKIFEESNGTSVTTTKGNINPNFGGSIKYEERNETPVTTTRGNINPNFGGNKSHGENNETPTETIYSKPTNNTIDIGYKSKDDLDNKDDMLEMSRNIVITDIKNVEDSKEMINKKVEEGYFPLFIKLDEEKPIFLFIKNDETMNTVLQSYKNLVHIDDDKKCNLYNTSTKQLIPQEDRKSVV